MSASAERFQLDEETVDDILYFARAGETDELSNALKTAAAAAAATAGVVVTSELEVLLSARDASSGNNALHMAAGNGHLGTLKFMLSLLPRPPGGGAANDPPHALVAHKNAAGNTPLHWAALNGHLEVVKLLLVCADADPTVVNASGHDAVYGAELNDRREVVEWILGEFAGMEKAVGGRGEEEEQEQETGGLGATIEEGVEDMSIGEGGVEES